MLNRETNILITGVTGLIGGELVRRLVRRGVGQVFCLTRAPSRSAAATRLTERLKRSNDVRLLEESAGLEAVPGDVTAPLFGMSTSDIERVTESTDVIIHCASELSFIRDASCRETNIVGMNNLIEIARRCRRAPLIVHISTATICGNTRSRSVTEDDSKHFNEDHFNEYTRSKAVAECVLRDSGLPALVIRPSIVLSADLPSENFARAILWFLPLLNAFDAIPVDPDSRMDVVPVSFVADSLVELIAKRDRRYDCYHVSAGRDDAMRCGEVAACIDAFYKRTKPLQLIHPEEWTHQLQRRFVTTAHQRRLFGTIKHYLPFLNMDVTYDNSRLRNEFGAGAVHIPPITGYLDSLLRLVTPAMEEQLAAMAKASQRRAEARLRERRNAGAASVATQ